MGVLAKPRKRKRTVTGAFAPVTPEKVLNFLITECEGTVLDDEGGELRVTPKAVRDKGIIVCSECGHYNSDSVSNCKYCHEKLVCFIK